MAYPNGTNLTAATVALNPSLHSEELAGLNNTEQALAVLDSLSGIGDRVITNMLVREPTAAAAGTWLRELAVGETFNAHFTNAGAAAQNDEFQVNMFVPSAGTYTLRFNAPRNANGAILKMYRSLVQIGLVAGYDLYNAALDPDNFVEIAGLVLPVGISSFRFVAADKNGASGDYEVYLTEIVLTRTA